MFGYNFQVKKRRRCLLNKLKRMKPKKIRSDTWILFLLVMLVCQQMQLHFPLCFKDYWVVCMFVCQPMQIHFSVYFITYWVVCMFATELQVLTIIVLFVYFAFDLIVRFSCEFNFWGYRPFLLLVSSSLVLVFYSLSFS